MLRCNRELLSRYKDGEVTAQERREVEAHLLSCADCAATLAAYRAIGQSILGLERLRTPASLRNELFTRIAQNDGRSSSGSFFGSFFSGLALAGTAVALILILSVFFRGMNGNASAVVAKAVYPPPEASNVSPASAIELEFNKPMDKQSVEESIAIFPQTDAAVAWQGEKLVLKPVPALAANTDYTITVSSQAKDKQGTPLKSAVVLRFSTGPEGTLVTTATATATADTVVRSPSATTTPGTTTPTATITPSPVPPSPSPLLSARLLVVDPKSPSTIFLAAATGVLYKSADGGASWRAIGSGLLPMTYTVTSLIVDPQTSQVVYLGTSQGVYRSADGGESWNPANNGLPAAGAASARPEIQTLVMHPADHLVLYASLTAGTSAATLYRSADAGASWSPLGSVNAGASGRSLGVESLVFYGDAPSTLFAGTADGVFVSTNSGAGWTAANKGLSGRLYSLAIQPKDYATLYAATSDGIYRTPRGSIDWQKLNVSIASPAQLQALSIAPDGSLWAAISSTAGKIYAIRSTDGGNSWSPVQGGLENAEPQAFAYDPSNPRTVYAATRSGVFKSVDGGERWSQLGFAVQPAPTPLPEVTVSGVISETAVGSLSLTLLGDDKETWHITVSKGPLQPTQIVFGDGNSAGFDDLQPLSRITATGTLEVQLRPTTAKVMIARAITIAADKPASTVTPIPTPLITSTVRAGYVYDSMIGANYTGDWPTRLRSRGFNVTTLDIRAESGFNPEGYDLLVIGWSAGSLPATNVAKLQNVKAPILNGYSGLVEGLGQGRVFEPGNPGRTVYGKTVTIQEGGALTWGYSGEVTVAGDTLYRVPIIAGGTVLATVTDEQQGVRSAPVWAYSDRGVYFGFWYSKDGTNHNEDYWAFFDRSVDYLLGRLQIIPSPIPMPTVVNR